MTRSPMRPLVGSLGHLVACLFYKLGGHWVYLQGLLLEGLQRPFLNSCGRAHGRVSHPTPYLHRDQSQPGRRQRVEQQCRARSVERDAACARSRTRTRLEWKTSTAVRCVAPAMPPSLICCPPRARGGFFESEPGCPFPLARQRPGPPCICAQRRASHFMFFFRLHMRSAGLLGKGLAEVQGAEALVEHAGAAGTARATPSRRAPSRIPQ